MTLDEITILHAKTLDFFHKNHTFDGQLINENEEISKMM